MTGSDDSYFLLRIYSPSQTTVEPLFPVRLLELVEEGDDLIDCHQVERCDDGYWAAFFGLERALPGALLLFPRGPGLDLGNSGCIESAAAPLKRFSIPSS